MSLNYYLHPDCTGAESIRNTDGSIEVSGVHCRSKSVRGRVANADPILNRLEFGNRANRAENLFLHNLHIFTDIRKDCGLDEIAFLSMTLATNFNLGTGFLTCINISGVLSDHEISAMTGRPSYPIMRSYCS